MTELTAGQLNVKFIANWPEAGGDLYQDNLTGSSFIVSPDDSLEEKLAEVRAKFEIAGEREGE
jgi:hypothetical protein